ncbi:MAG: aminotransferase class III-fold pyridoxal phosphate-dependent enzyme [Planctomycetota bacterium]|nr:aminotransferase class III-fold pyridoxal phosphate-dependent enzyme [Planctomycetota bacterium]
MKFAFLVHPLTDDTRELVGLNKTGRFTETWGKDLFNFLESLHVGVQGVAEFNRNLPTDQPWVVDYLPHIGSLKGFQAEGRIYEIPMLPHEILLDSSRALGMMEAAVDDATAWGAKVMGLGSMTGIVGGRGTHLADYSPISVTTGNCLTVFAALQGLEHACRETGVDLSNETVSVVGVPGSIATAAAKILKPKCKSILLVGRSNSARSRKIAAEVDAEFTCDVQDALARSRVVFTATSSGDCIDQKWLSPATIVVDVAVPTDVIGSKSERDDVLILTGGLSRIPEGNRIDSSYFFFQRGMIPSCLGETIVLALEERCESYSLGQDLSPEKILKIGELASENGFNFTKLCSFGAAIDESVITNFRKTFRPASHFFVDPPLSKTGSHSENGNGSVSQVLSNGSGGAASRNGNGHAKGELLQNNNGQSAAHANGKRPQETNSGNRLIDRLAVRARALFRRHMNSVVANLGESVVKNFVRGEGCHVWDDQGNRYLDFVAGFGSLNLGHNHPAVHRALETVMRENAPGFVQAAINPLAATLAEKLVTLAPPELDTVFYTNSGTESVEAALKTARLAGERSGFLYCRKSYHGKSLGSLSVTGNRNYQRPFEPLVPGCEEVDFGDVDSLRRLIRTRKFAAFIVEPIQAEGGMIVPPAGYFEKVQELCRETETLLIVDEVQTGIGRTGSMFASEFYGIRPDILTVAKSLGGGMVPIGAMLIKSELWKKAYGTLETFALHTSTFGGGSLACSAGMASLEAIQNEKLLDNALEMGQRLKAGLAELCDQVPILKEVRGEGLLLGLELNPINESIVSHWKDIDESMLSTVLGSKLDDVLRNISSMYVMNSLMNHHRIYTQTARSNPLVLRIQPPLTVNEEQVDYFLKSVREASSEVSYTTELVDGLFARTGVGDSSELETPKPAHS